MLNRGMFLYTYEKLKYLNPTLCTVHAEDAFPQYAHFDPLAKYSHIY